LGEIEFLNIRNIRLVAYLKKNALFSFYVAGLFIPHYNLIVKERVMCYEKDLVIHCAVVGRRFVVVDGRKTK
jgi:hypothetical protein